MSTANPSFDGGVLPDLDATAKTNEVWHARFTRDEIQELLAIESWRGWVSIDRKSVG